MLKEFKNFIMRGNVFDLAVGVVIGSAFTSIVTSVVNGIITPIVGWVIKLATNSSNPKFTGLNITPIDGVTLEFGTVISALITFLITAFVLFIIVKGVKKVQEAGKKEEHPAEKSKAVDPSEIYLKEIRDLLRKQETEGK